MSHFANEWEALQNLVTLEHNKRVRVFFKNQRDLADTGGNPTPKERLKHSCLIKDDDSALITLTRLWLFEITLGHAQSLQAPIYGIPVQEYQIDRKFRPQVKLHFLEPWDNEVHAGNNKVSRAQGEITFRLMDETTETITRAKAVTLARAIKKEIATPPLVWGRGWYKATYFDLEHGYDFRLLVKSKLEAVNVIRKILGIQNHLYNDNYFQFVEHERTYSLDPGTHRVYGSTLKKPIKRRRADVRFTHAQLLIWGRNQAVNLVALAGSPLSGVIERI